MLIRRYMSFMLGLTLLVGCGKPVNLPKLYPVKGTVTSGGQPVTSGKLALKLDPDNPDVTVNAFLNPNGTFEVVTLDRDGKKRVGALEGTYRVTYVPQTHDQQSAPIEMPTAFQVEAKANEWIIDLPEKK